MASSDEHSVTAEEPGPAPTHSTKHELQIKPDEQGLWRNKEGILWPVLVLRNELVPNMMRKRFLHEDEVPILLFNKNDIVYVKRDCIRKQDQADFLRALQEDLDIERDSILYSAYFMAYEERDPITWLEGIRKEYGTVTTAWNAECEARGKKYGAECGDDTENNGNHGKRSREKIEGNTDVGEALHNKRQKFDSVSSLDTMQWSDGNSDSDQRKDGVTLGTVANRTTRWTAGEDAELIRIRERVMPDAPWEDVADAFYERFADSVRTKQAMKNRYRNYLHPDAIGSTDAEFPIDFCIRMRARALQALDRDTRTLRRSRKTNENSFKQMHNTPNRRLEAAPVQHWTVAEDAELIRLNERSEKSLLSASQIFQKNQLSSKRSLRDIRHRYKYYLQENAFGKCGKATDEDQCILLRTLALSILDSAPGGPAPSHQTDSDEDLDNVGSLQGSRWSDIQDAHLLYLENELGTSWTHIAELLNVAFPEIERTGNAVRERYRNFLQHDAWSRRGKANKSICEKLRARALSLMDHVDTSVYHELLDGHESSPVGPSTTPASRGANLPELTGVQVRKTSRVDEYIPEHPGLEGTSARKWTAEEDAHLIRLREVHMKDTAWSSIHDAWTKILPQCSRTQSSLRSRYSANLVEGAKGHVSGTLGEKECAELRNQAFAFLLREGENRNMLSYVSDGSGRRWSSKEDAELIRLREFVVRVPDWKIIHRKMKKRLPTCKRTAAAVAQRYTACLAPNALGDNSYDDQECRKIRNSALATLAELDELPDEQSSSSDDETAGLHGQRYTAAEDAEIIRLRERIGYQLQWDAMHAAFKRKFTSSDRSVNGLQERYMKVLAEDATERADASIEYCENMRRRALHFLDKTGSRPKPDHLQNHKPRPTIVSLLSDDEDNDSDMACIQNEDDDEEDDDEEDDGTDHEVEHKDDGSHQVPRIKQSDVKKRNQSNEIVDEDESDDEVEGDTLTFLVGKENAKFRVPVTRALSNAYIIEDTVEDNILGAVVTGARWSRLTADAFRPIYQYLKHGDYRPYIKKGQLVGLSDSSDDHAREIVRCGSIFNLARELQLEELVGIICQKFMLLKKQPLAVMVATRIMYRADQDVTRNELLMRQVLIDEIGGNYQTYMEAYPKNIFKQDERTPGFSHKVILKHLASSGDNQSNGGGWEVLSGTDSR